MNRPMPIPCKIPPYAAARILFSVIDILPNTVKSSVVPPSVAVVIKQFKINFQPINLKPNISIGALINIINNPAGNPVIISINDAAPLTPPPTISLGIKNTRKLKEYEIQPKTIKKYLCSSFNTLFFLEIAFFNSSIMFTHKNKLCLQV